MFDDEEHTTLALQPEHSESLTNEKKAVLIRFTIQIQKTSKNGLIRQSEKIEDRLCTEK